MSEHVNINKSSTKFSPVSSIVYPPNITPLLPGSVLMVKSEHAGGRVPVMTGIFHSPGEYTWYNYYDVIHVVSHVIPGNKEIHIMCTSFVMESFG